MDLINRQWTVAEHPISELVEKHFKYQESSVSKLVEGEVLLKTHYLNIAPVMRMYMMKGGAGISREKHLKIGEVIHGRGIAEVLESFHPDYQVGDFVHGQIGWQTYKVSQMKQEERFIKMKKRNLPVHYGLSALGMTGYSAYCGFMDRGQPHAGDTVLVSGAAGGVGSLVIQIAKAIGCKKVVGIAGGPEKCAIAMSLGADDMIDYKKDDIESKLDEYMPEGFDVFFDNVGGAILESSLNFMKRGARVVLCGGISEYTLPVRPIPQNIMSIRSKAASILGFLVYNHTHQFSEAEDKMAGWITDNKLSPLVDMVDGFDKMPEALMGLYSGTNIGKRIVKVIDGPEVLY